MHKRFPHIEEQAEEHKLRNQVLWSRMLVEDRPTSSETPNTKPTRNGNKNKGKILQNKDNKHICTPIYPILGIQDNHPRTCDLYNV